MNELSEWDSFYLIVGGAAGALIGLQFVVMTLIASRPQRAGIEVGDTFATPTIVHFSVAFLLAAVLRAPWKSVTTVAVFLGLVGIVGVVYSAIVTRRMSTQTTYKPVFEDWLFHSILPLAGYAIFTVAALAFFSYERQALFGVGGAALLLLFVGIHNAWDAVTYNVFVDTHGASMHERPGGDSEEEENAAEQDQNAELE